MRRPPSAAALALAAATLLAAPAARAQAPAPPPHEHGAPAGWRFTLPRGDASCGRAAFGKLECFKCHVVPGRGFPVPRDGLIGPDLAEVGTHHEAEYIAESIVNPNTVVDVPAWRAPDGTSRMPSFNDSLTVQELIDLVAFVRGLAGPASPPHGHRH